MMDGYVVVLWKVSSNLNLSDMDSKKREENKQISSMLNNWNKYNWMERHEHYMEEIIEEKIDFNLQGSFVFFTFKCNINFL